MQTANEVPVDWMGQWYALQEEMGEYAQIRFGCVQGSQAPVWHAVPHQQCDGIGAFAHLLRSQGYGDFPVLPQIRSSQRSGDPLRRPVRASARVAQWRDLDEHWIGGSPEAACPAAVHWEVLSQQQSRQLDQRARSCGVSLNSLGLWALHRAVSPWLVDDPGPSLWAMPVNMRGAVAVQPDTANQFAIVDMELSNDSPVTPEAVHAQVRALMAKDAHWHAWNAWRIGERVGLDGMRVLLERNVQARRWKTGIYSNLGQWDDARQGPPVDWIFLAPVTHGVPFAACLLTWRGRLCVAVQAHPALSTEPRQARVWLESWLGEMLGE